MKLRLSVVAVITGLCLVTAGAAHAACFNPDQPGSPGFGRRIRELGPPSIIVRGVIARRVPPDAHAAWSIFLDVERYLVGQGKQRIEITSYSDGDLRRGALKAGASKEESRAFLKRNAGRAAIFFAGPEKKRYDPGYSAGSCLYNRVGHRDVVEMERLVLQALAGRDGMLVRTGVPAGPAMIGLVLCALGVIARRRAHG